jgi:phosphoribosylglycinamide formyltransferase 1
MKNIAIFASGSGSNAENIIRYFSGKKDISVAIVVTNNPKAEVIQKAERLGVAVSVVDKGSFNDCSDLIKHLGELKVELIVLAGFLWKIPDLLLKAYHNRIINIHPSLLPRHGGKGMYGNKVHEAVLSHGDQESGITIHYVNEHYDEGEIIQQVKLKVEPHDTPAELAKKIQKLEHYYFPLAIEQILSPSQHHG